METLLTSLFHKTDVLEAVILTNNASISQDTFQEVAKSLDTEMGIRAIQYLPGGTVEYCYPIEGNEAAIGGNVFNNPKRVADAQLAVDTKSIALSGPYTLTQGGLGLVARNPIFVTDENGNENFWGFAVIILDLPEALQSGGLEQLEELGYLYRLSYLDAQEGELQIAGTDSFAIDDAVSMEIQVPNHYWTLWLMPTDGWINWRLVIGIVTINLLICLLISNRIVYFLHRQERLSFLASRDELTGLLKRKGILDTSEYFLKQEKSFFMLYMDVNKFKSYNDEYGHALGDEVLKEIGKRLQANCGNDAVCGRIGGDEFVAIISENEKNRNIDIVTKLKDSIEYPFECEYGKLPVSISVGMAAYPKEGTDYDALMKVADQRMYQQKNKN